MLMKKKEQKNRIFKVKTMNQILDTGVTIFTIGQYLQPSKKHLPVVRYVKEQEFKDYKQISFLIYY